MRGIKEDFDFEEDHPSEERPRTSVEVVDTNVSASSEAVTRSVVGKEIPNREGEVDIQVTVTVECTCGENVTVYNNQGVNCGGCGRRWEV
jgi:hypothetical protein